MTDIANGAAVSTPHPSLGLWVKVARPFSLTATMSPLLVGTAVAAYHRAFNPWLFLAALFSGLFLQIGANYFNEFFDWKYSLDTKNSLGASTVIFQGTMSARQVLFGGVASFVVAALLGITLIATVGYAIILFGVAGIAIAYFYSARPFRFATRGLGDILVFLAMGFLMTWGAYFVQIHHWSWSAFAASIPVGFLVVAILNMNNIRDFEDDRTVAKQTVVVRFGLSFGKNYQRALVFGAYGAITIFALVHLLPILSLAAWFSLPTALTHIKSILPTQDRKVYMRGMKQISALHLQFGVLMSMGIAVAALARMPF